MRRRVSASWPGTKQVHHDEHYRLKVLINNGLRKRGFEHARRAKSLGNLKKFVGTNRLKRMKPRMQVQNRYTHSERFSGCSRAVSAGLSRRRPRVRASSDPPTSRLFLTDGAPKYQDRRQMPRPREPCERNSKSHELKSTLRSDALTAMMRNVSETRRRRGSSGLASGQRDSRECRDAIPPRLSCEDEVDREPASLIRIRNVCPRP